MNSELIDKAIDIVLWLFVSGVAGYFLDKQFNALRGVAKECADVERAKRKRSPRR